MSQNGAGCVQPVFPVPVHGAPVSAPGGGAQGREVQRHEGYSRVHVPRGSERRARSVGGSSEGGGGVKGERFGGGERSRSQQLEQFAVAEQ